MPIERFTPEHPLWTEYLAHLKRVGMARGVIEDDGQPKPDIHFLGVAEGRQVVGHISVRLQDIIVPATRWSGGQETSLTSPDSQRLRETFVQTFAVDETYRRRGYGRALQLAALDLTKKLGGYQMRSWSSLDKPANYALKLSLGFTMHPATQEVHNGQLISGVYFIKTV